MMIRDISSEEIGLFGGIVAKLERCGIGMNVRDVIIDDVIRLLRADFGASYVWSSKARRFANGVHRNMDEANYERYANWYQFRDPHTFQLRDKRRAALVEEVTPYPDLHRTEFYNDFLAPGGLAKGINLFLFDGEEDVGDFRIWRGRSRPPFGERELALLDALSPFMVRALIRAKQSEALTTRELEVALLVARGCTDRDIARLLGISFGTVRTHVNRAMAKCWCSNRAELAASIARDKS